MPLDFPTGHPIPVVNPVLYAALLEIRGRHQAGNTISSYRSALRSYEEFCEAHCLSPFPADPGVLSAWMVFSAPFIKISSLRKYISAVRSAHLDQGMDWADVFSEGPRRTLLGLRRTFGDSSSRHKVPISLALLLRIARCLPGFPSPFLMSHADRLFVTASLIAVLGFLRGGEFLFSRKSARPLLRARDVRIGVSPAAGSYVEVEVRAPKARWWEGSARVRCFAAADGVELCAVAWLRSYQALAPFPLPLDGPAFALEAGRPLQRAYMVQRTTDLLAQIGVQFQDLDGRPVQPMASSWRAGGVVSAIDAGLPEDVIRTCGRWASSAWTCYRFISIADSRSAATSMHEAALRVAGEAVSAISCVHFASDPVDIPEGA